LAGYIIGTLESRFRKRQPARAAALRTMRLLANSGLR
jgi:hypothetical protein